ncbi:MAG: hypothetical protein HKN23_04270 [Verrucomicrobiales bacterium]|nr:hypothetical protein [Verrucomicrobiales bacterium]
MFPPRSTASLAIFLGAVLCFSVSCKDQELERRVEMLEAELKTVKSSTQDRIDQSSSKSDDINRRMELSEQKITEAQAQVSTVVTQHETRFQRLEKSISDLVRMQEQREKQAYLRPGIAENIALQTELGSFLVRLVDIKPALGSGGSVARINLGNPSNIAIQEFTLKGDFGGGAPVLKPGEQYTEYSKRLDEWQKGLTPFEQTLVKEITPNSWTTIELPISATGENPVQLIRFTMTVKRAQLAVNESNESNDKFSVFYLDAQGASVLKTDYGGFLISPLPRSPEPDGIGRNIFVKVGNPTGFTVKGSKLIGQYGPKPPSRLPGEQDEMFSQRISNWKKELRDFEADLVGIINETRWSEVSFYIPESELSRMQFFRVQLKLENVSLR